MIFIVLSLISMRGCLATKKVWDSTAERDTCVTVNEKSYMHTWGLVLRKYIQKNIRIDETNPQCTSTNPKI
jgi:hypothetical protein